MESRRERAFPRTKHKKVDITSILRKSWYHLRLSVRHPSRVPTWDAIVLTAASPEQAQLYEWQLNRAKRMGRIASSTITLAVPDPDAQRIGSGAATLNAIFALARHYQSLGLHLGEQVKLLLCNVLPDLFFDCCLMLIIFLRIIWKVSWENLGENFMKSICLIICVLA